MGVGQKVHRLPLLLPSATHAAASVARLPAVPRSHRNRSHQSLGLVSRQCPPIATEVHGIGHAIRVAPDGVDQQREGASPAASPLDVSTIRVERARARTASRRGEKDRSRRAPGLRLCRPGRHPLHILPGPPPLIPGGPVHVLPVPDQKRLQGHRAHDAVLALSIKSTASDADQKRAEAKLESGDSSCTNWKSPVARRIESIIGSTARHSSSSSARAVLAARWLHVGALVRVRTPSMEKF